MTHLTEELLNDLADDALSPDERASADAHLAACAECRAELQAMRALHARLVVLPRAVAPSRDLLAGIHAAIDETRVVPIESRSAQRTLWSARWALAAAAVVLVIATAVITRSLGIVNSAVDARVATQGSATLVRSDIRVLEDEYQGAIADLEQLVTAQRVELSPATIALLEKNLRVIDEAIRESRAALEQDPANEMVNGLLRSAYERKLDLLRRATTAART